MGDISDGSSGAASDAQTEGSKTTERGFIGRFFDAFGADKDAPPQSADDVHRACCALCSMCHHQCHSACVYMAYAKTPLDAFEKEVGMALTDHDEIDEEDIDTLGGLVFMISGHVPARGELIVHPDGPEFEVVDADPRRIKRLRVRMPYAGDS